MTTVTETLMAPETASVVVDYTPVTHDLLTVVVDGKRRPQKLYMLIKRLGVLIYPPLVLVAVNGDETGLDLELVGPLWWLGSNGVGPTIADREYVSGFDKLDNGSFDLGELYWRRASQGGMWVLAAGVASNVGGLAKDDVLESEREFPTRPGYAYRVSAAGVSGTGRLRLRTIYEGRFNPANLLTNPGFESGATGWTVGTFSAIVATGARTGTQVLRFSPIVKPQLVTNSGFESGTTDWTFGSTMTVGPAGMYEGTQGLIAVPHPKPQLISNGNFASGSAGWTLGATFAVTGGALVASPNPQPQFITDSSFETGTGWTAQTTPAPMSADITLLNNAGEARSGSWSMKAGPVTQHQVLMNADFENGLANWYESSDVADPDPGIWFSDVGGGLDGSKGAGTGVTAGKTVKYLRADSGAAAGVQAYPVKAGEQYTFECYCRAAPGGTNGTAYVSLHIPHPTVANRERWFLSQVLEGLKVNDNVFRRLSIDLSIPANRFTIDALLEVHDSTVGTWVFDNAILTRTRGNRAQSNSNTIYGVSADTGYELAAMVRSDGDMQVGSVRLGVIVSGSGMSDEIIDVDKGSTDYEWTRVVVPFKPKVGYTSVRPFIAALDIVGEPAYVDLITLTKVENNTDVTTHSAFTVVPDQRYILTADVSSAAATIRGGVSVGVTLSGSGMANQDIEVTQAITAGLVKAISVEVRPGTGYTTATPYVRSKDIAGGTFTIDNVFLTKADNNTDETTHSSFVILVDQRYVLSAAVRSAVAATKGKVTVGLRLTGAGLPTQSIDVSHDLTAGEWKAVKVDVRADAGYTTAVPFIITTDIEGGNFSIDNVKLTKFDNNTDTVTGTAFAVTPERTYRWAMAARSGAALQVGTVRLSVRCTRAGFPDVSFDSSSMEATANAWKFIDFDFTPPSGYATVFPSVVATDVEGDFWYLDDGDARDTDTETAVFDTTMDSPAAATANVDTVAPAGAEFVRVAVIVEQGSSTWTVGSVSLARTGVTPATGNAIIADLLKDPDSLLPLSLAAGAVTCPEVIPYDWVIQNLTNRDALDHYANVVSEPVREYRVMPTLPATLKVGTQAQVFTTHAPADALLPEDIDVQELSNPESNVEERATEIEVIGAELQTVSGRPFLITATAQVPGPVELDFNGRAIVRTKQVSDGTVDNRGYAVALAEDLAAREAEPALALNVRISGIATRPDSPPGDSISLYEPEAGLEDPTNPVTIEGVTVFPRRTRVLARERSLGPSYTIEMRRSDGTTFALPGVRAADEDATVLTVGDRLPDWVSDPQGSSAGEQYTRDRASRPR